MCPKLLVFCLEAKDSFVKLYHDSDTFPRLEFNDAKLEQLEEFRGRNLISMERCPLYGLLSVRLHEQLHELHNGSVVDRGMLLESLVLCEGILPE